MLAVSLAATASVLIGASAFVAAACALGAALTVIAWLWEAEVIQAVFALLGIAIIVGANIFVAHEIGAFLLRWLGF